MKYIVEEKAPEKPKSEPELKLSLLQCDNGTVDLRGEDGAGREWFLLKLERNGTFYRFLGIGNGTGMCLDENGRMVESPASKEA